MPEAASVADQCKMKPLNSTRNNARLASLLLAICTTASLADTTQEKASPHALQLIPFSIGLAAVQSISLPGDWSPSKSSTSTEQYFHATKASWFKNCEPGLTVRSPYKYNPEIMEKLEDILSKPEHQLSVSELSSLSNLISPGTKAEFLQFQATPVEKVSSTDHFYDSSHISGQTVRIDGKMTLIVEQTGTRSAPCIFFPDGNSVMPICGYWNCFLYVTLPGGPAKCARLPNEQGKYAAIPCNQVQEIFLDMSSIIGLDDDCIKAGSRIIRTLKWQRASK